MDLRALLREMNRRRVFRVAAVYAVVAFILVQVADLLVPALLLPDWALRFVAFLLLLGFPVALVLAWAFDLTPEGVTRTDPPVGSGTGDEEARPAPPPTRTSRAVFYGGTAVVALAAGIVFGVLRSGAGPDPPEGAGPSGASSIAVLPFVNLSPDRDQEYFADGLTEDLITNLSRIPGLRVISRPSVMRYKESSLPLSEIAAELDVSHVLAASVRRESNAVRISAQLLDPARDDHLWSDVYDREITGIFEIQSEIAQRIADALEQQLAPEDRARIAEGGTGSIPAYELVLRGREYLNRPGEADLAKFPPAMTFFRQAIEVDPEYARGHVGLSEAYRRNPGLPMAVRRDSARVHARTAVELDPELAEAAAALGFAHLLGDERSPAEREFRRALAVDPNQADAMSGLARLSVVNGRLDEAARWARRAVAVDPFSTARLSDLGRYLFDLGDLEGARDALERAVALAPDLPEASYLLAHIHLIEGDGARADERMQALASSNPAARALVGRFHTERGRYDEAEAAFRQATAELGAVIVWRVQLAKRIGEEEWAEEALRTLEEALRSWEEEHLPVPPRARLDLQLLRGDRAGALATLEEHWPSGLRGPPGEAPPMVGIYWIDHDPALEEIREDPAVRALLVEIRAALDSMRTVLDGGAPSPR